jgi:hypothetical protein
MTIKERIYFYLLILTVLLVSMLIAKTWCDSEKAKYRYRMTWDPEYREWRESGSQVIL